MKTLFGIREDHHAVILSTSWINLHGKPASILEDCTKKEKEYYIWVVPFFEIEEYEEGKNVYYVMISTYGEYVDYVHKQLDKLSKQYALGMLGKVDNNFTDAEYKKYISLKQEYVANFKPKYLN